MPVLEIFVAYDNENQWMVGEDADEAFSEHGNNYGTHAGVVKVTIEAPELEVLEVDVAVAPGQVQQVTATAEHPSEAAGGEGAE